MPLSYQEVNKKLMEIKMDHPILCEILVDWNTMRLKDYEILINRVNELQRKLEAMECNE